MLPHDSSKRTIVEAAPKLDRRAVIAGLGAVGAAGMFSSTPAFSQDSPRRGGVLRLGFSADPAGFDPIASPSGMSQMVIGQLYSTLFNLDADAQPQPNLAQGVQTSSDGLHYTFALRPGVTFHDGAPLTAEDVKFTFDRLRDPASGYVYVAQVASIASVDIIDPLTVSFSLSAPTGPFLTHISFPGCSIVPKHLVGAGHDLNASPIGSGPFKFVDYRPRSRIQLARNENYFEAGRPYLDGLDLSIISDSTSLTSSLLGGGLDFSNEVPPKDWSAIVATAGMTTHATDGSRFYWLVPNHAVRPLDKVEVRQAIAHAISRNNLVRGAFFGQATPILGGTIPAWSWAYADLDYFAPAGDPERAKALLAAAGYPNGFEISFTIGSSFPAMTAMAPIIQANLAAVGIRARIQTVEVPRFWDEVWSPSRFDLSMMYWLSPLADPDDFVTNNYACDTPANTQQSCSPTMDALLAEARAGIDQDVRHDAYRRQQELSLAEMPIIPLVNARILTAHTTRLKNFVPMRTGFLATLKDAWLAP